MEDDMASHEASTHDSRQRTLHAFVIFIRVGCSHFPVPNIHNYWRLIYM